jgi:hypothetical protein
VLAEIIPKTFGIRKSFHRISVKVFAMRKLFTEKAARTLVPGYGSRTCMLGLPGLSRLA